LRLFVLISLAFLATIILTIKLENIRIENTSLCLLDLLRDKKLRAIHSYNFILASYKVKAGTTTLHVITMTFVCFKIQ